jgi:putative heme iron utilization protein
MNDDHMSSTIAMVAQAIPGLDVSEALITSVDSLGMYVKCTRTPRASDQPQQFKIRLPFPRKIESRKDVKDVIVEMTRSAQAAAETK